MKRIMIFIVVVVTAITTYGQKAVNLRTDSMLVHSQKLKGITFSHDNSVTLLMNGQEKFDDMFEAIRQAKQSVHLEYFNFRNDSIASLLFNILAEKAKQGVEVRALFDSFGNSSNNRPLKNSHIKAIRERGIQIYEFDPIRFPWVNHIWGRDHRKIVVIDGKIAYTGGMNVADYYIKGTRQVGEWRDMHCRLEGTEVNTLQRIFIKAWKKVTGQDITNDKYFHGGEDTSEFRNLKTDSIPTYGHMLIGVANREPRKTPKATREFYLDAINLAQDTIRIVNPYFVLIPKVKKALINAVNRGVVVQIMVSEPCDVPLTPDCVFYNVNKLQRKGCQVWIYKPGFHHTKIIMVDGRLCTVGSTNLDSRSLRCDYEENLEVIDPHITKQLTEMFERDKTKSFRLTPTVWKTWRSPWQRFRGWFAHLLAFWL